MTVEDAEYGIQWSSDLVRQLTFNSPIIQDLRNWHIGRVRQISMIWLFAGFMQ